MQIEFKEGERPKTGLLLTEVGISLWMSLARVAASFWLRQRKQKSKGLLDLDEAKDEFIRKKINQAVRPSSI